MNNEFWRGICVGALAGAAAELVMLANDKICKNARRQYYARHG